MRRTTLDDDSDFLREVAYWQRRGASARFAESWRLMCLAYGLDPKADHPMTIPWCGFSGTRAVLVSIKTDVSLGPDAGHISNGGGSPLIVLP